MGGGQELVKRSKLEKAIGELDIVNFSISNNSGPECYSFYDGDKIFKIIEIDIEEFFTHNGIMHAKEVVGDMGGGYLSTIMDCLLLFKDSISQLGLIISILKLIGNIFSVITLWCRNYLHYQSLSLRPQLTLSLSICSNKKFDNEFMGEFQSVFSTHLASLGSLGKAVLEYVKKIHPLIDLDLKLTANINHVNFHVEVQIGQGVQREYNFDQLINILRSVVVVPNYSKEYSITKWLAIRREDSYMDKSETLKRKTYFFFLSGKVISDYFGIKSRPHQLG